MMNKTKESFQYIIETMKFAMLLEAGGVHGGKKVKIDKKHLATLKGKARSDYLASIKAQALSAQEKTVKNKQAKAAAPKPVKKEEPPAPELSAADKLIKSGVNMGMFRTHIKTVRNVDHKIRVQHSLTNDSNLARRFNSDPVGTIKSIVNNYKPARDPRSTPSLGGGQFGNYRQQTTHK